MSRVPIAVLIAYTGDGGVEKMVNHLLEGLLANGHAVDLLLLKARGHHLSGIPDGVRVIPLNVRTSLFAVPALRRYLLATRPLALLAAKDRAGRAALLARRAAGTNTRVVLRIGMHLSGSLADKNRFQRALRYYPARWLYPWADAIVTVARPIAEDLAQITRIPLDRFHVIPNPTIGPEIYGLAATLPSHPWFDSSSVIPVILAAGRLKPQKDFPTLLRAFTLLRKQRNARLVILGEGPQRAELAALAEELGISRDVDLPGFQENPYGFMHAARLFVLSSRFEGAPNVLIEAMALGTPVVATDCPSGPREILQGGQVGRLVPVGDVAALAAAMARELESPTSPERLREAVNKFTIENSTLQYLRVFGVDGAEESKHASAGIL